MHEVSARAAYKSTQEQKLCKGMTGNNGVEPRGARNAPVGPQQFGSIKPQQRWKYQKSAEVTAIGSNSSLSETLEVTVSGIVLLPERSKPPVVQFRSGDP